MLKSKTNSGSALKIIVIVLAVAGLLFLFKALNVQQYLKMALEWIEGLGMLAPVVFTLLYIVCSALLISAAALTLGAGLVFGVVQGTIYVSIASILAATVSFLIGRYVARGWVSKKIAGNKKFKAIDEAVGREGWKIVGLTRLSPIFPFTILNYAYGVTKVSLRDYFFASWIGMLPGTIMYVYLGSLAGSLAGSEGRTPGEWALYIVGLLATVAVTIYVTKIAKKALNEKVSEG